MADNLKTARFAILVEGESDKRIFEAILKEKIPEFGPALSNRLIVVDNMGGGAKASYQAGTYKKPLVEVHLIVDSDDSGRSSAKDVISKKILENSEVTIITCPGMRQSEIEDIFDLKAYKDIIFNRYNVHLDKPEFRKNRKVWSERVKEQFGVQGAFWDESVESEVKTLIADQVERVGFEMVHPSRSMVIDSLVDALSKRIGRLIE